MPGRPEIRDWIIQPVLKVHRNPVAADEEERREVWSILHKRIFAGDKYCGVTPCHFLYHQTIKCPRQGGK